MNWSFVIIYLNTNYLDDMIRSIVNQEGMMQDSCEVILVGDEDERVFNIINDYKKKGTDISFVYHNEKERPFWITRKKNIGVRASKYENVCISHDYIGFCKGWYKGFVEFGSEWDVCMNPVRWPDDKRFRDWIKLENDSVDFVSYNDNSLTKTTMYVSGTYWCAKRQFMINNPQDENLAWGWGEDIEWSNRCKSFWNYRLNANSSVKILKNKLWKGKLDYFPHPRSDMNKDIVLVKKFDVQT